MSQTSAATGDTPRPDGGHSDVLDEPHGQSAGFRPQRSSDVDRAVLALVSLLALSLGLGGLLADLTMLRVPSMLLFCLVGVGTAPWQFHPGLRLPARLSLGFLVTCAVFLLGGTLMVETSLWHPTALFAVVAVAAAACHAVVAARLLPALPDLLGGAHGAGGTRAGDWWEPALIVVGAAACLVTTLAARPVTPGRFGFLRDVGPFWYLGLTCVLAAAVVSRRLRWTAVAVVGVMLVLTLTPALVYDGPRSQSAFKHVDFLQQIRSTGSLKSSVEAYNAWPGFFAGTAWISHVAGIRDPMDLARFWPPLLGLFRVAALRYLFGRLLQTPRQAWVAMLLTVLADPLGADYFSPQSIGFVLGLVVVALALGETATPMRLGVLLLGGLTLGVSHQLSPYIVGGVLIVLVVFRQVRPWWLPALVLGPAMAWTLLHWSAVSGFFSLKLLGREQNFRPPTTKTTAGLSREAVVGQTVYASVAIVLVVGLLALAALLWQRRSLRAWAIAVAPAVGLALVAVNPYGGEGLFRAVLFGMPWLCALAAITLTVLAGGLARPMLAVVSTVLAGLFLVAAFGLDASNVVRQGDVTAIRTFRAAQSSDAETVHFLLLLGPGDLPTSPDTKERRHQTLRLRDIGDTWAQSTAVPAAGSVARMTRDLDSYTRRRADSRQLYALWSPVSLAYAREYGIQTPASSRALRDAFLASPAWKVEVAQDGTYLFRHVAGTT